jgi:hypothetical protein
MFQNVRKKVRNVSYPIENHSWAKLYSSLHFLTSRIGSAGDRSWRHLSSHSIEGGLEARPCSEPRLAWSAEEFPPSGATPVPCTVVMETPLVSPYYLPDGVATPRLAGGLHPLCWYACRYTVPSAYHHYYVQTRNFKRPRRCWATLWINKA